MVACNFKCEMCDYCGELFGPDEEMDHEEVYDEDGLVYVHRCSACRHRALEILARRIDEKAKIEFDWSKEGF